MIELTQARTRAAHGRTRPLAGRPAGLCLLVLVAMACLALPALAAAPPPQPQPAEVEMPGLKVTPGDEPAVVDGSMDLSGSWRFKGDWLESGLSEGWQNPAYDDSTWKELQVPATWEEQGITTANPRWPSADSEEGYNGFAWYRKHFVAPAEWAATGASFEIGAIDDHDWVYVNGQLVGATTTGESWDEGRLYAVPGAVLKPGQDNVIAIRVFDRSGTGGITEGPVRLSKPGAPETFDPGRFTRTKSDLVRIGGGVNVARDEKVEGDVVAIGGPATIAGWVTGDVVAIGGPVNAEPDSRIDGDVVSLGGSVDKADSAFIGGDQVTAGPGIVWLPKWSRYLARTGKGPFDFFRGLIIWGFISLLAVLILRPKIEEMAAMLPAHPARAALVGLVGVALTPAVLVTMVVAAAIVMVLLAVTIVGVLLIPAVAIAMVALLAAPALLLLVGVTAVFAAVGGGVLGQLGPREAHPIWAALLGLVLTVFAGMLPVIGALIWVTVAIFGYGLATMASLDAASSWHQRRRGGPPPAPPAPLAPPAPAPPPVEVAAEPEATLEAPISGALQEPAGTADSPTEHEPRAAD